MRPIVVLSALGYALEQAYSSWISILYRKEITSDDMWFMQCQILATEITDIIRVSGLDTVTLPHTFYYNPPLLFAFTHFKTAAEVVEFMKDYRKDLEEAQLIEDFEDAASNCPCDTWGMLACSPRCKHFYQCNVPTEEQDC